MLLQRLPWLLFGLHAGALADRLDRRLLVVAVNSARAAGPRGALPRPCVTGVVSIAVVLGAMFVLGVAEVFADTTTSTLLPMVVDKRDLGIGNARIMAGMITANQMVGPPIGAALFALGMALPFVMQAVCVALGAVLISRMVTEGAPRAAAPSHVRQDIREGFRWTWGHAPIRTLTLAIVTFNVTWGAAWSVLVLYSIKVLEHGLGRVRHADQRRCRRRPRRHRVVRLARATLQPGRDHAGRADHRDPHPPRAGGEHVVRGRPGDHVRLRRARLRVGHDLAHGPHACGADRSSRDGSASVYMVGVYGGLVVGSAVGGVIAELWGITAPFWFAFVGSAVILALIWRQLDNIAHADEAILAKSRGGDV